MLYTVFSGLTIAWRRANCPTRRSPLLLIATTEGTMLPPSAEGITTGSPPCITAISLNVVPKSIPTTFPILPPCSFLFVYIFSVTHHHFGRTKNPIMQFVPFFYFLNNNAFFTLVLPDGFMQAGVERLIHCLDSGQS